MFVPKLTAVLNDESGETAPSPWGFSGQDALQALEEVHDQDAGKVEEQHRDGVGLPALLDVRPDARGPVDQALEPAERAIEPDGLPLVDPGHVEPERLRQSQQHDQVERQLKAAVAGHENTSGFSSATTR